MVGPFIRNVSPAILAEDGGCGTVTPGEELCHLANVAQGNPMHGAPLLVRRQVRHNLFRRDGRVSVGIHTHVKLTTAVRLVLQIVLCKIVAVTS